MTLDGAIKHCEEVADVCEFEASKYDMTDAYESHVACEEDKIYLVTDKDLVQAIRNYQDNCKIIERSKEE